MILKTKEQVTQFAELLVSLDIPYIWGGNCFYCQDGLDCSGFFQWLIYYMGIKNWKDKTAQGIYDFAINQLGWKSGIIQEGAWIFYSPRMSTKKITHIAYAKNDKFIIEAGGGGSNCTSVAIARKLNAGVRSRLISRRTDIVAVIIPPYKQGENYE